MLPVGFTNEWNSLSPFAGAAMIPLDEIISTKLRAIKFNWFIVEIDGILQKSERRKAIREETSNISEC